MSSTEPAEPGTIFPPNPALSPYWAHDGISIYHADALAWLPAYMVQEPPPTVACVITAPPWRGGHYMWAMAGACEKAEATDPVQFGNFDSDIRWAADKRRWVLSWLPQIRWLLDVTGLAWIFVPSYLVGPMAACLSLLEWPIRWTALKPFEALLVIGHRALATPLLERVTKTFAELPSQSEEATLPLPLIDLLLEASGGVPGVVLDPFMGDGGVLVAAQAHGLKAIGVEWDQRRCDVAAHALEVAGL